MNLQFTHAAYKFYGIITKKSSRCSAAQRFLNFSNSFSVIEFTTNYLLLNKNFYFYLSYNVTTDSVYLKPQLTF